MLYSNCSASQEMLLRRKLEEQQAAAELQLAIELHGRRFMGLQLLDLHSRSFSSAAPASINSPTIAAAQSISNADSNNNNGTTSTTTNSSSCEDLPTEGWACPSNFFCIR